MAYYQDATEAGKKHMSTARDMLKKIGLELDGFDSQRGFDYDDLDALKSLSVELEEVFCNLIEAQQA